MSATEETRKSIKELRNNKDWTQFELAAQSGVSLSAVISAENEQREPLVNTAIKIARALGVRVEDISWKAREK
jgi:DNA-binding XRE family transcriptional regulator